MNVFVVVSVVNGVSAADGFKGAVPFIFCELVTVALFIAFPEIVLFVPNLT